MVVTRGWKGQEMGNYCSVGTEFQFGVMKQAWRWMVVIVTQQYECT